MSTFQLVLILLGFAGILFIVWILKVQRDNKRACIGHIWATFYTTTGGGYSALCATDDNQVEAPDRARMALEGATKGKLKTYFIRADKTFNVSYPPGKPSWLQTIVSHTAYYEGLPDPIVSRDPKERMIPISSPRVIQNLKDEKMSGLLLRVGQEMDELRKAAQAVMSPKVIYLLLIAAIVVGMVNIFFSMDAAGKIARLAQLWGL